MNHRPLDFHPLVFVVFMGRPLLISIFVNTNEISIVSQSCEQSHPLWVDSGDYSCVKYFFVASSDWFITLCTLIGFGTTSAFAYGRSSDNLQNCLRWCMKCI